MSEETTIVNEAPAQLVRVINDSGLEPATADTLKTSFAPYFSEVQGWLEQAKSISITSVGQVREMKLAREIRLALREIRINAEKTRKRLKEDSLRRGKAIDGINNVLRYLIEPVEKDLLEQEQFVERKEAERKEALRVEREKQLLAFGADTSAYLLGEMSEEVFANLLRATQIARQERIEAERKAAAERIAREKAEAEERERIRKENERLRKEAVERENAAKAEREAAAKEKAALEEKARKERESALAKLKAERLKAETAAKKERDASEAKLRAEREAREKLEREAAERTEHERRRKAAEAQVQRKIEEAARKAAAAPDRDKLLAFASQLRQSAELNLTSEHGRVFAPTIRANVEKLASYIEMLAGKL